MSRTQPLKSDEKKRGLAMTCRGLRPSDFIYVQHDVGRLQIHVQYAPTMQMVKATASTLAGSSRAQFNFLHLVELAPSKPTQTEHVDAVRASMEKVPYHLFTQLPGSLYIVRPSSYKARIPVPYEGFQGTIVAILLGFQTVHTL